MPTHVYFLLFAAAAFEMMAIKQRESVTAAAKAAKAMQEADEAAALVTEEPEPDGKIYFCLCTHQR